MYIFRCGPIDSRDAFTEDMEHSCAHDPPDSLAPRDRSVASREHADPIQHIRCDWRPHASDGGPTTSITMRSLHSLLRTRRHDEFRDELARAEIAQEISEFHALNFRAMLAIAEDPDNATDYLEMAQAVAASPYELGVISESLAAFDLRNGNALEAAMRCLTTLDRVCQTEGLWVRLLVALYRLGDVDAVDTTLQRFTKLDDESHDRLMDLLSSDPELREVRTRPAFTQLVRSRRLAGSAPCAMAGSPGFSGSLHS